MVNFGCVQISNAQERELQVALTAKESELTNVIRQSKAALHKTKTEVEQECERRIEDQGKAFIARETMLQNKVSDLMKKIQV